MPGVQSHFQSHSPTFADVQDSADNTRFVLNWLPVDGRHGPADLESVCGSNPAEGSNPSATAGEQERCPALSI